MQPPRGEARGACPRDKVRVQARKLSEEGGRDEGREERTLRPWVWFLGVVVGGSIWLSIFRRRGPVAGRAEVCAN